MFTERTSVGLDVHARSVVAAAIDSVTGELIQTRLTPSHDHIRSWLGDLPGPVAVAYEAGPTGFGLSRSLTASGIGVRSSPRASSSGPAVTGSRPMSRTPFIWRVCCGWMSTSRCRSRASTKSMPVTLSAHVGTLAAT